jgi:hypothetical protein
MSAIDIARGLTQLRPDWNIDGPYQFGEIGAVGAHGANTVDVYLDGSTSLTTGLHYSADYGPQVNDPVMIGRMQGSSQSARFVLGPLAPGGTIHGGPPTSTPYAGARIFDTKYGVTWWYDGSAWHANGPGLITARMYLSTNTALNYQTIPFDQSTLGGAYDPLTLCTTGVAAKFTCPIAGQYRVTVNLVTTTAGNFGGAIFHNGALAQIGGGNSSSTGSTVAVATLTCAATDTLQGWMGYAPGTAGGGAAYTSMEVEFVSS